MSVLPISFHDLFGIDQVSEISTSAKRRKQLSISPTALQRGLLSLSDAVFKNVIAAAYACRSPTDFPAGRSLRVIRIVCHAAEREQNRRVKNNDRVQSRKHVAVDARASVLNEE